MATLNLREVNLLYGILNETRNRIAKEIGVTVYLQVLPMEELKDINASLKDIILLVAKELLVEYNDILGDKRDREYAEARFICVKIIKERYPDMTVKSLGQFFNRDHSTIVYALRAADDLLETNTLFQKKFSKCIEKILTYQDDQD